MCILFLSVRIEILFFDKKNNLSCFLAPRKHEKSSVAGKKLCFLSANGKKKNIVGIVIYNLLESPFGPATNVVLWVCMVPNPV